MPGQTPSQTVGPFFHLGLYHEGEHLIAGADAEGQRIRVEGRVLDGAGAVVPDAMIEVWQADAHGRYAHPDDRQDKPRDATFKGFGRAATDVDGRFWFETVKPGQVPGRGNVLQAPHLNLTIFARGMLSHLYTRLYFADETAANEVDPVLSGIAEVRRRGTLIAARDDAGGPPIYRLDIVLQGDGETVFFDA
jgi:protocatechuate 3,4-dioxygenase alpha subunit